MRSRQLAPKGCGFLGYEKRELALKFMKMDELVAFSIRDTQEQPLENPAFVIANWGGHDGRVSLKTNGQTETRGAD